MYSELEKIKIGHLLLLFFALVHKFTAQLVLNSCWKLYICHHTESYTSCRAP